MQFIGDNYKGELLWAMGGNNFLHDGEHGRSCTDYGCDCAEKNYGYHSGGRSGGGGNGGCLGFRAVIVIGSIVGAMNPIIGSIVMIVLAFIVIEMR